MWRKGNLSEDAVESKRDNVNVHRAAAKIIVSKSRAARGSVCNVLLSDDYFGSHSPFVRANWVNAPSAISISSKPFTGVTYESKFRLGIIRIRHFEQSIETGVSVHALSLIHI